MKMSKCEECGIELSVPIRAKHVKEKTEHMLCGICCDNPPYKATKTELTRVHKKLSKLFNEEIEKYKPKKVRTNLNTEWDLLELTTELWKTKKYGMLDLALIWIEANQVKITHHKDWTEYILQKWTGSYQDDVLKILIYKADDYEAVKKKTLKLQNKAIEISDK